MGKGLLSDDRFWKSIQRPLTVIDNVFKGLLVLKYYKSIEVFGANWKMFASDMKGKDYR